MSVNGVSLKSAENLFSLSYRKAFRSYLFAAVLSFFTSLVILRIGSLKAFLLPFDYFGDAIFYAMTIKSVITTGWYLEDPSIGAPGGHFLADFPTPEGLNYLFIKFLSLFSSNWVVVLNLFFLLGFPLITISSLFVLTRIGLAYPLALSASLLYTFLPYRFIRGESHLFLSSYYMIPLVIWLALLLYQNKLFENGKKMSFVYVLISIALGSNGVYYAYFGSFFILVGGVVGTVQARTWSLLKYALFFISLITMSLLMNVWPTVHSWIVTGRNFEVAQRDPVETEMCGLKIAQLLLPRDDDRLFSSIKDTYNHHAIAISENASASLGLIGSLGFIYLIGHLFLRNRGSSSSLIGGLADFNLSAVLLATIGGFSSLISLFFLPQIRAYNRISVFMAFFSLSAFFFLLQEKIQNRRVLWWISLLLFGIGLYNQSSPKDVPFIRYKSIRNEYKIDRDFVGRIEKMVPLQSKIFQLPYIYFPEGPRDQINSYAHFKPALHSKSLQWSFGAMKGREVDLWQRETSALEVKDMIRELVSKGFVGLYIDKYGYTDGGNELMAHLRQELKIPPIFDKHGRSFWDLRVDPEVIEFSL